MNLQSDDFELFGLPVRFAQDRAAIDVRWKELQREAHPDKFAAQGPAAQRVAMQWSVRINEAYQRLKDPVKRAAYLCEMHGVRIDAENNTTMPSEFLIQQMEWREALEEADNEADVDLVAARLSKSRRIALQELEHAIDVQHDWKGAAQKVRALMFIERFASDVEARLDAMDTAGKGQ